MQVVSANAPRACFFTLTNFCTCRHPPACFLLADKSFLSNDYLCGIMQARSSGKNVPLSPHSQPACHDQSRRLAVKKVCFYTLALCLVVSSMHPAPVLAEDDGAALLEERCSGCHPKSITTSKRKSPKQWQATVSRMKHRGCLLYTSDAADDYLTV